MAAKGGKARADKLTKSQRKAIASKGGNAAWAGMTEEERSAVMLKRAAKRKAKGKRPTSRPR